MRWDTLFFDLDGTLTDPMQGITRSVQYALLHFGIEVTDRTTLCSFIGPPLKDSFREFYGINDLDTAVKKYHEYFKPTGIFENTLYEGIPEMLADLKAQGVQIVMATSKPTVFAEQIAEHFDLRKYFTLISGSALDGSRDRKADVIRYALDQLGIQDTSRTVMIGDRRFDIEGATETGLASIGVLYGYGDRAEIEAARPDYIVENVAELHDLLKEESVRQK